MKLYENVIIGNFLYGLGLDIGIKIGLDNGTETLPSIINLLQQTPADKELGDMLLEFPGVVRVLEFKNAKNPKYHFLNLTNITLLNFNIDISTNDKENIYTLTASIFTDDNNLEQKIAIADFESKKDAENALLTVKNKLFAPEKKIVKFTAFIAFIIVIWSLIVDVSIDNLKRTQLVNSKKQEVSLGQVPVAPLAGNQQNLEAILQQAIAAQTAQAAGGQAPQQPQVAQPEQAQQTPSDFLIKSLN